MIFNRISYRIALQFMAFVFLLILVNGIIFLAADFGNARRQTQFRMDRSVQSVLQQLGYFPDVPLELPPLLRERVRILDAEGTPLYSGSFFAEIPFSRTQGYAEVRIQGEHYRILTTPIVRENLVLGFAQIVDVERHPIGEIPRRATIYLFVSALVSLLTFLVGLQFARGSLKPAEQMMERLEQFTQDASHELRTPLATLNSSLDLALKTEKYREGLISAKEDVQEISALIERLLELARLDRFLLNAEVIDLSALVEDAVERLRPLAEEQGLTVEAKIDPNINVKGDAGLLRQVMSNLLSNAIKFNKPQGVIRVKLAKNILSIEDTGLGIPLEDQSRIFDRFYQADTSRALEGFGLGLALVKRIIELHGWSIGVKSTPEQGSTFTINFSRA